MQFSLSENVKTNVLWGTTTVSDSVILRPWGDTVVKEQEEEKSDGTTDMQTTKRWD